MINEGDTDRSIFIPQTIVQILCKKHEPRAIRGFSGQEGLDVDDRLTQWMSPHDSSFIADGRGRTAV